jgi:phosphate transport system substrate-binding protein
MVVRTAVVALTLSYCLFALAACDRTIIATPQPIPLTITGATAMQPVLRELATEFTRLHPNVRIELRGGGSTVGEERVSTGQTDLGASTLMVSLPATPTLSGRGQALVHIPIGLDGLAIVVQSSNVITGLTILQLRDLYAGRILDWAKLGSGNGEVLLVSREDGSGSRQLFEKRIMGDQPVSLTAVVMPTSADVVAYVAKTPAAIGYVSLAYVRQALPSRELSSDATPAAGGGQPEAPAVRVVPLENLLPSPAQIKTQNYFLTQPLFLISQGEPQGEARAFVEFVLSSPGQAIVERYHARIR